MDASLVHHVRTMRWVAVALGLLAVSGTSSGPDGSFGSVFFPDPDVDVRTPALLKTQGFSTEEEVEKWFSDLSAQVAPSTVHAVRVGTSPKGRAISAYRVLGPQPVSSPVRIWIQGALHGDEQATPDGVMLLVEEVLKNTDLANRVELLVVPIANPDGYARAMRQSASGLDLNRDLMMRQGQENVQLMRLFEDFEPEVALDFHEYRPYRSDFTEISSRGVTAYYDNMFLGSSNLNVPEVLRAEIADYVKAAGAAAAGWGYRTHAYFVPEDHEGTMRMRLGSASSRSTATNYALHNCVSALIETRGVGQGRSALKRRVHSMAVIGMQYIEKAAADPERLRAVLASAHADPLGPVISYSQPIEQRRYIFIDLAARDTASFDFATRNYSQMKPVIRRSKPKFYALRDDQLPAALWNSGLLGHEIRDLVNQPAMAYEVTQRTEGLGANNQRTQKVQCSQVATHLTGRFVVLSMDQRHARLLLELLEPELDNSMVSNGLIIAVRGKQLPYYAIYETN